MLLAGMHLPLTTPFYPDGRLNVRKLTANIERYSKSPTSGLVVLGRQGEASLLSDADAQVAMREAIGAAAPEKIMVAGVSRDSVAATLESAENAADLAYDALLVGVPAIPLTPRELLTYFLAVADRSPAPLLLAGETGRSIPFEVLAELSGHPEILGAVLNGEAEQIAAVLRASARVKREVLVTQVFAAVTGRMLADARSDGLASAASLSGGVAVAVQATRTLKTRSRIVGFQVLGGDTARMLEGLRAGAVGTMPGFGACAPQACYEVFQAWKDDDPALAEEKQARLLDAARQAETMGVGGIKYGCDLNGYFGGLPRLPLLPPTEAQRGELARLMSGLHS